MSVKIVQMIKNAYKEDATNQSDVIRWLKCLRDDNLQVIQQC